VKLTDLQKIVCALREFAPGCIIGGGAVRDTLLGRPVKDIDVFVQADPADLRLPMIQQALGSLGFSEQWMIQQALGSLGFSEQRVVTGEYPDALIADFLMPDGHPPIQVITLGRDPVDDVHHYDFGLSQCFVTPNGLFVTDKHTTDFLDRTITYTGSADTAIEARRRSAKRLARLREKYSDFIFLNCEHLEDLE
jgi:hypothetical protein